MTATDLPGGNVLAASNRGDAREVPDVPARIAREWTVSFPAPIPLKTENRRGGRWQLDAAYRKTLRDTAYGWYVQAKVPMDFDRPHITVVVEFPTLRDRDSGNLEVIAKPLVDALGPEFRRRRKDGSYSVGLGIGAIGGDSPRFLGCEDCAHKRGRVLAVPDPRFRNGRLTVVLSEASPGAM